MDSWLRRYGWYVQLPANWKQITHRLVREIGPEVFVGMDALHEALSAKDRGAMWDALEDTLLSDVCIDLIEELCDGN